jgi:hypothetical protein
MRVIRTAIGATTINPELLTCAERLQLNGQAAARVADTLQSVQIVDLCPISLRNSKLRRAVPDI